MFNGLKILIVAPHADDEVLGCGGLIAKYHKDTKFMVEVVCFRGGITKTGEDIPSKQLKQSSDIGHQYHFSYLFSGFQDEKLDMVPMSDLIKAIERTAEYFGPDIVFIPNKGDINYDHKIVHEACLIAFRKIQAHPPKKLIVYEVPSSTTQGEPFDPNLYIELTEDQVNMKSDMLSVYEDEIRPEPNPRNKRGIKAYAVFRGMECNKQFAEAFKVIYEIV